ncbi:MAG: type VI secretion system-associated FHA domain protein TagH [Pseudomonadales bacterium]
MAVTLQVVGASAYKLADRTEMKFSSSGTIGRAEGNTYVLPDPERFISSNHAAIEDRSDGFYLVDTSINGTYVNDGDQPIGHGNAHRLADGDRIRIGEFELLVSLQDVISQSSQWPAQTSQSSQWPSQSSQWPLTDSSSTPTPTPGDPLAHESVDPLQLIPGHGVAPTPADPFMQSPLEPSRAPVDQPAQGFGGFTPPRSTPDPFAAPPAAGGEPGDPGRPSSVADPFATPSPLSPSQPVPPAAGLREPAGSSGSVIPEDWDKTTLPGLPPSVPTPAPDPYGAGPAVDPGPAPAQAPWDQAPEVPPQQNPPYSPGPPGQPVAPSSAPPDPFAAGTGNPPPMHQAGIPQPPPDFPSPDRAAPGPTRTPAPPAPGAGIAALLETAGLDQATARALDNPATSQALGVVLRLVIKELMEVLRARAEVKNQFRVHMTQMNPSENNPLKFCVDEIDALQRLLVQQGHGFQGIVEALDEGFGDVKAHQIAMMAGMRAAFDHLLKQFDPDALRRGFDLELRRSKVLQPLNKTKYWDMLGDLYRDISGDSDANFARLFGDEFARAYEAQMDQLRQHRKP